MSKPFAQFLVRTPYESVLHIEFSANRSDLRLFLGNLVRKVRMLQKSSPLVANLDLGEVLDAKGNVWDLPINGPVQEAKTFVYYLAGYYRFDLEELHRTDVAVEQLTAREAAALYSAIGSVAYSYIQMPEEVMQDPSKSGDLIHEICDEGFSEESAKRILRIAGYRYV